MCRKLGSMRYSTFLDVFFSRSLLPSLSPSRFFKGEKIQANSLRGIYNVNEIVTFYSIAFVLIFVLVSILSYSIYTSPTPP